MNDIAIWWLDQTACEMAEALGAPSPLWPAYIQEEFESRRGRSGRGRLWQASCIIFEGIEWKDGDIAFDAVGRDCGGIVIRRTDAPHILAWPGFVSDETLRPITVKRI